MTRWLAKAVMPESAMECITFMEVLRERNILDFIVALLARFQAGAFHGFCRKSCIYIEVARYRGCLRFARARPQYLDDFIILDSLNSLAIEKYLDASVWSSIKRGLNGFPYEPSLDGLEYEWVNGN